MANAIDAIKKRGKTIGYIRVSTLEQNISRQLDGVELDKVFIDRASGKDAERTQLKECLGYLREDDTLVVHSMDRLARNVEDLLRIVRDLVIKGVTVRFLKENMSFSPNGNSIFDQLMLTLLGAFAEFERSIMMERQAEGIAKARQAGRYKGRPPNLSKEEVAKIVKMINDGVPKAKVARKFKISRTSLYRYINSSG